MQLCARDKQFLPTGFIPAGPDAGLHVGRPHCLTAVPSAQAVCIVDALLDEGLDVLSDESQGFLRSEK